MDIAHNPVILFFGFGILAGLMKSNLEIPTQIAKFLSLYLLMAIGLKGGVALHDSGFNQMTVNMMVIAVSLAFFTPFVAYVILRQAGNELDAIAVAATYGSISAVTFVTATQFLSGVGVEYDGYMSAAMALMEAPAILVAMLLLNIRSREMIEGGMPINELLFDSFREGTNLLLLASLVIGYVVGHTGYDAMKPFTGDLFIGILAFFLLDMGIQVAKNIPGLRNMNPIFILYAAVAPIAHAMLALTLCTLIGASEGNTVLMMVLAASASYIAVPAALKVALPEANPSVYLGLSLGITFPFNVVIGIPLYYNIANW